MDEQSRIETEADVAKKSEDKDLQLEAGLKKLEQPPNGDFIAGLRSFIDWVKDLVSK